MAIKAKAIVALLTMAACSPLAFAQDPAQGQSQTPPPAQQGQAHGQGQGQGQKGSSTGVAVPWLGQGRNPAGVPGGPMGRRFGPGGQMNGSGRGGMRGRANWRGRGHGRRRHHRRPGFRGGRNGQ
ncbi:MAG: hypothetical protein WB997_05880, partial [Candidatus Acidiferrales bacterium]